MRGDKSVNIRGSRPFHGYSFILLTGCLFFAITILSCSTNTRNRGRGPEVKEAQTADQIITQMKSGLHLSDEQEIQIRPIVERQVQERNMLLKKYASRDRQGREALRDDLKELRVSTEKQLQYYLTNEQMIQYGDMQREEDQRLSGSNVPQEEGRTTPKNKGRRSGR